MRIVITSDLHYQQRHPHTDSVIRQFVEKLADLKPDCLIIGGDIGEGVSNFDQMLVLLRVVDCPRLVLAGNHDLWVYPQDAEHGITSDKLWLDILPRLTREHGAIWLEGENWIRDGVGICGTIGWYDFTARDPSIAMSIEEYASNKKMFVNDGIRLKWDRNDVDFAEEIGEAFSGRLQALDNDSSVREILVVTHVPAFEEGIIRKSGNIGWNISNAYFGNLTLGTRILASSKVHRVISGHTHVGVEATILGTARPIEMQVIGADYGKPAYVLIEIG
ncbi:MAG: metallophosphoesterase [Anaerolineae bacterium]|nr:metallophosphoesterase [Anaerolineae bacterium]